jgi:lipopolysaccharide export LptBFGC system permease protein LptF
MKLAIILSFHALSLKTNKTLEFMNCHSEISYVQRNLLLVILMLAMSSVLPRQFSTTVAVIVSTILSLSFVASRPAFIRKDRLACASPS